MSKYKKKSDKMEQLSNIATSKNLINLKHTKDEMGNKTFDAGTHDSFVNFMARLGLQADNLHNQSGYTLGPFITRNRLQLEASYRDSWIVGKVVDCIAEDMTRDGCNFYSQMEPDDIKKLQVAISEFGVWQDLSSTIKWARLYGGAIAVILIDGADYTTLLDIEKIGKNKFKGLAVLDRWMLQPSMGDLITEINQDMGKPKFYEVLAGVSTFPAQKIHHTRVLRFEGIELPYYQKLFENLWGLSVVERMFDRLLAFDSATTGAAQLVYKAYLRTIGVKGFREALAVGGRDEIAVIKQFEYIRQMQNNEGITVLDSEDTFATHQYNFSGLDDLLGQFGQQISGAVDIPLVRLFGQSPRGFSTGDTDLRNYYDHINKLQENQLRRQLEKLFAVISMSRLHKPLPEDFEFDFVSLWQLSETEKAAIAQTDSNTMTAAHESGTIRKSTALKELLQSSRVTGRFSNISAEDIEDAENESPPSASGLFGEEPQRNNPSSENVEDPNERLGGHNTEKAVPGKVTELKVEKLAPTPAKDGRSKLFQKVLDAVKDYKRKFSRNDPKTKDGTPLNTMFKPSDNTVQPLNSEKRIKYQGIDIIIENSKGTIRKGVDEAGNYFETKLPADYGFIEGYLGNDGEAIDCFIGPNKDSDLVVILKQRNIVTGGFDEEKVIFGCNNKEEAGKLYVSAFNNSDEARSRIIEVVGMNIKTFKDMLNGGV